MDTLRLSLPRACSVWCSHVSAAPLDVDDAVVSHQDTESLMPSRVKVWLAPRFPVSRVRRVCCAPSKTEVLISRGAILLVGVAFVVVGVVVALTATPLVSVDCDTGTNATNCSLVCQSFSLPTPTRTRGGEGETTPPFVITPSPTSSPGGETGGGGVASTGMIPIIITPSPSYVTTPINETSCDCLD